MPEPALQVEQILDDIRERVFSENGAVAVTPGDALIASERQTDASAMRIETYLKTTDQLRGSLPPVRSYRRGAKARLEIWIKAKIRRATKWFFFDQVNFNSTVHQLLTELNAVQLRQEATIEELRKTLRLDAQQREQQQRAFNDEQKAFNEEQRRAQERQQDLNEQQQQINDELRTFRDEQKRLTEEQRLVQAARDATLERLRVELSESAVVIDRLRRNFEHRLTKLESEDARTLSSG